MLLYDVVPIFCYADSHVAKLTVGHFTQHRCTLTTASSNSWICVLGNCSIKHNNKAHHGLSGSAIGQQEVRGDQLAIRGLRYIYVAG